MKKYLALWIVIPLGLGAYACSSDDSSSAGQDAGSDSGTVDSGANPDSAQADTGTDTGTGGDTGADTGTDTGTDAGADGPLNLSGTVTTLAGTLGLSGSADGTGPAARFTEASSMTADGTNLYVADTWNHDIRKVVIATGVVTTLAGAAGFVGSADGTGAAARFRNPTGITTDGTNLYVADNWYAIIRKIVIATGQVTTIAGSAGQTGTADGTGSAARFYGVTGITTDGTNLFVCDSYESTIRKIVIATGVVTTLAGTAGSHGGNDGVGAAARFRTPTGITTDGTNLYVADRGADTIRTIVIATGAVTTLAGTTGLSGPTDGVGAAARFSHSVDLTTDGTNLYVSDGDSTTLPANNTIRKIVIATGTVSTFAGTPGTSDGVGYGGAVDGVGAAARFRGPYGIAIAGGALFVFDGYNRAIRKIQ